MQRNSALRRIARPRRTVHGPCCPAPRRATWTLDARPTYLAVDDALAALLHLCDDIGREQFVEPCEQLATGWELACTWLGGWRPEAGRRGWWEVGVGWRLGQSRGGGHWDDSGPRDRAPCVRPGFPFGRRIKDQHRKLKLELVHACLLDPTGISVQPLGVVCRHAIPTPPRPSGQRRHVTAWTDPTAPTSREPVCHHPSCPRLAIWKRTFANVDGHVLVYGLCS
jgi:hypothetical protein